MQSSCRTSFLASVYGDLGQRANIGLGLVDARSFLGPRAELSGGEVISNFFVNLAYILTIVILHTY